jgi:hypothetical protein
VAQARSYALPRWAGTEIPMAILVAFDKHYFEAHVPIAKKIPGLRKYEVSQGPVANPGALPLPDREECRKVAA